jgi:hypothetical protein
MRAALLDMSGDPRRCYVRRFPRPTLVLGEEGRGRIMVRVPVLAPEPAEDVDVTPWERLSIEITDSGPRIVPEAREDDRVLFAIVGCPGYSRGRRYEITLPTGTRVLARGQCAWGDAGYVGCYEELLVVVPPQGELVWPAKYGRVYVQWSHSGVRFLSEAERDFEEAYAAEVKEVL